MAKTATKARKKVTTKIKTRVYDTANYLPDEQDMAASLEAALGGGDAAVSLRRWVILLGPVV